MSVSHINFNWSDHCYLEFIMTHASAQCVCMAKSKPELKTRSLRESLVRLQNWCTEGSYGENWMVQRISFRQQLLLRLQRRRRNIFIKVSPLGRSTTLPLLLWIKPSIQYRLTEVNAGRNELGFNFNHFGIFFFCVKSFFDVDDRGCVCDAVVSGSTTGGGSGRSVA